LAFLDALTALATAISLLTAKFSAFLLWCSGFQVSLQGVYINLPTGSVKVYSGCSGMESMTYLLGLSVICLVMFPIQRRKQIFVPIVAVAVGFFLNGVRIAFLTVLIASLNKQAFDYWHEGEGSLIFGMIAVMIFGFFYLFLLRQEEPEDSDAAEL
jgi:cyanoexosortase A